MTTIELLNLDLLHAAADQAHDPFLPPDVAELCRNLHDHDEAGPDELPRPDAQYAEEL